MVEIKKLERRKWDGFEEIHYMNAGNSQIIQQERGLVSAIGRVAHTVCLLWTGWNEKVWDGSIRKRWAV